MQNIFTYSGRQGRIFGLLEQLNQAKLFLYIQVHLKQSCWLPERK